MGVEPAAAELLGAVGSKRSLVIAKLSSSLIAFERMREVPKP